MTFTQESDRSKNLSVVVASPQHVASEMDSDLRFRELILPHLDYVTHTARAYSRNEADAQDLTQDTLVRAYRAIDRFDGAHPKAWLRTIARNLAINRTNRQHRREIPDLQASEEVPDHDIDPQNRVENELLDPVLEGALARLGAPFRAVIQIVDIEGGTYAEASEALDIPLGTVMSRLHRGRRRMADALVGSHLDRVPQEALAIAA